jgi:gliding motility-associated-like protein
MVPVQDLRLSRSQTSYDYSGGACPNAGEYSLLNLTFSCFENNWHTLSGDHTPGDAGGYYMLVNSESTDGNLFVSSVKGLCPNTTYEFATWVKNALRPTACNRASVKPNIQLTIETTSGNILASYNSGDISEEESPEWKQYGMLFKTSSIESDLVLRITSTAPSGCGNVIAIDDITVRPCGPKVDAKVASNGLNNIEVCEGAEASFLLTADYGSEFINPLFQWETREQGSGWKDIPGANSRTYLTQSNGAGTYSYRMIIADAARFSSPKCRIFSNEVTVKIQRAPFVQATNYVYGCLGGDVSLMAGGANEYFWTGPNGYSSNLQSPVLPKVQYSDSGMYKVTGTTDLGCQKSDSTILRVYPNATATSSNGTFICEGLSTTLVAGGGIRYQWEPSSGLSSDTVAAPRASPIENTRYQVKVTNKYGCSDTAYIKVNVWKTPQADAGPDLKTRLGLPVSLRGTAMGSDISWLWTPTIGLSAPLQLNPLVNPPRTTTYTLHVTSAHGCGTSTDDVLVKVFDKIVIPNAFSPNGDGINDTWLIEPLYLFDEAVTEVYNRYGQVIYRSRGYSTPWNGTNNGKPIPVGTYYYIIDLRVNKEPKFTGSVTILR